MANEGVIGSQYLPNCSYIRWDDDGMSYWCHDTGKTVSHMDGYTGICNGCVKNSERIKPTGSRTVYLLWAYGEQLCGVFQTRELAQRWVDAQLKSGAWTAGEHAASYVEPVTVYDRLTD